jgi:ElaA protein
VSEHDAKKPSSRAPEPHADGDARAVDGAAESRVRFEARTFEALGARELHDALALRQRVFVIEQACLYLDVDGNDPGAEHVLGWEGERLVAYARVLPPGVRFEVPTIGRVVVAPEARGRGLARALMLETLAVIERRLARSDVALSAQAHLEGFYASLGFVRQSETYDEDGIPHVDMRRTGR